MKFLALAGTAAIALAAVPAAAQDDTGRGFNGIHVGVSGGYDVQPNDQGSGVLFDRNLDGSYGDVVRTGTGANAFSTGFCAGRAVDRLSPAAGGRCVKDKDGWSYNARIGVDAQRGNLVVGVLGEFGKSEIRDSVTAFSTTPAAYVFNREIGWEGAIRGRVGFTPNDTTLFYASGGPGYARIDRSFFSTQSANLFVGRGKRNQFGIQGGGGIEQRIGSNLSIGVEYLFHRYNDDNYVVRAVSNPANPAGPVTPFTNPNNGGNTAGTDFIRTDEKFRWHSIRATLGFRF